MTGLNHKGNANRTDVIAENYASERILIDEKHFEDRGGALPNLVRYDFAAPRFAFEEAARRTVRSMSAVYSGIDERIIEKTFDEIRKGLGDR